MSTDYIDIVFDGAPGASASRHGGGPEGPRFVEAENDKGEGIRLEWVERENGLWAIRVPVAAEAADQIESLQRTVEDEDPMLAALDSPEGVTAITPEQREKIEAHLKCYQSGNHLSIDFCECHTEELFRELLGGQG